MAESERPHEFGVTRVRDDGHCPATLQMWHEPFVIFLRDGEDDTTAYRISPFEARFMAEVLTQYAAEAQAELKARRMEHRAKR